MSFTPAQCRAARALLNWSQAQLAGASGVATKTVADFERESRTPYDRTLADVRRSLEAAGVEFTNGDQPGVRLKRPAASKKDRKMSYFLIHRFNPNEPHQVRKQPFGTEPEAVIRACELIMANANGDFIVEDDEGNVVANDQEIRNRCKATRMP